MIDLLQQAKDYAAHVTASQKNKGFKPTHLHAYTDEQGSYLYFKPRLKHPETGEKYIRSISLDDNRNWQMKDPDFNQVYPQGNGKKPLYNLHGLALANSIEPVYIFEGEQKADLANKLGLVATTAGGSKAVNNHFWQPLHNRRCVLWRDNDQAGIDWLKDVITELTAVECAEFHVIDVDQLGLQPKDDIVDYVERLRGDDAGIENAAVIEAIKNLPIMKDEQVLKLLNIDDQDNQATNILPQSEAGENEISLEFAQSVINQLAQLSELEYQLKRTETAKALNGMPVSALDKLVKQARLDIEVNEKASVVQDVEPYADEVDGSQLADTIHQIIVAHIACDHAVSVAATLWIFFSWAIDISYIAPIAWINAPERRCGKSQLATIMGRMSKRTLSTTSITPAALFRCIEKYKPTLVIDEADTFFGDNDELRGIINAGFSRDNPYIIRSVGDDHEPTPFNVFGAKIISGIGKLPGTVMDRSISLTLRRKLTTEQKNRLRLLPMDVTDTIKTKLARWTDDNAKAIENVMPTLPESINDRAQDAWEILFKIASVLGDDWLHRCQQACLQISGVEQDEPSVNEQLLNDIKNIFEHKRVDRIFTSELIIALCSDPELMWSTYNRGKPITPRQLSKKLEEYEISSGSIRIGQATAKGYYKKDFLDAFSRYLSVTPFLSVTASQPSNTNGYSDFLSVTTNNHVTDKKTLQPSNTNGCVVVTDKNPLQGQRTEIPTVTTEILPSEIPTKKIIRGYV